MGEGGNISWLTTVLKKIRETLYTLLFADFFIHIARGKLKRYPPASRRYRRWELVKSAQKILVFKVCSGGTQPLSSSMASRSLRYLEDFGRDSPAICRPQEGFFHNFSIFIQSFPYGRRQRIATLRYRHDLNRDPPALMFLQRMYLDSIREHTELFIRSKTFLAV